MREQELYPLLSKWLNRFLRGRHGKAEINVFDSSKTKLSNLLFRQHLTRYFPYYNAFDIQVDITGIVEKKNAALLAFVECKANDITLRDVGQIWGYSKVASPEYSFLISPTGPSESLLYLLKTFGRYDLLEYRKNKRIIIANRDIQRKDLDYGSVLPPGELR